MDGRGGLRAPTTGRLEPRSGGAMVQSLGTSTVPNEFHHVHMYQLVAASLQTPDTCLCLCFLKFALVGTRLNFGAHALGIATRVESMSLTVQARDCPGLDMKL